MTPNPRDPEHLLEHAGYVRKLARELAFDAKLAHDLEQEIWLAALQNVPRDLRHPRAWLATVARHLAWRARRGQHRREERELRSARAEAVPSSEEVLEREELRAQIVRAVLALDEPYRSALVLRYLEELSPQAAADRLSVPVETLRTRVKRGVHELKRKLERDHGGDHGAWCLALVLELRLEPGSTWMLVRKTGAALLTGGSIVMSAHKGMTAAAGLLVLLAAWMAWNPFALPMHDDDVDAPRVVFELERGEELATAPTEATRTMLSQATPTPISTTPEPSLVGHVRLHVEWSDGAPASAIGVRLHDHRDDERVDARHARTDEHGDAIFDDVPAGTGTLQIDRWNEPVRFELRSATTFEKTVRLPAGIDLAGHVRDAHGGPVADARVLISSIFEIAAEREIARSAADGSFVIRGVVDLPIGYLLAVHPSYAASTGIALYQQGSLPRTVELVLDAPGGALIGRVFGPDGEPIEGALVFAGDPTSLRLMRYADGREAVRELPLAARANDDGAFSIEGLRAGPISVWVRAPSGGASSLATWKGTFDITALTHAPIEVHLEPGVEVTGIVVDRDGQSIDRAVVETRDALESFALDSRRAITQVDGRYRLAGLSAGPIELSASIDSHGEAHTQFHATRGARLEWNPRLSTGLSLRGRIESSGRALGTLDVRAWIVRDGQHAFYQETFAHADGRFEFVNCPDVPHHIEVVGRGAARMRLAMLDGVRPGLGEVIVTIDPNAKPDAFIRARVIAADGKPVPQAIVSCFCMNPTMALEPQLQASSGELSVGPIPAGVWSLTIMAPGHAVFTIENHTIAPGETWDAGTLQLARGGTALVRARRADGQAIEFTYAHLRSIDGSSQDHAALRDGEGRTRQLPPGRYDVVVAAQSGFAHGIGSVEIAVGEDRECEVVLHPGMSVEITWSEARAANKDAPAIITISTERGLALLTEQLLFDAEGRARTSTWLAAGRYTIASHPSGAVLDEIVVESQPGSTLERALTYRDR